MTTTVLLALAGLALIDSTSIGTLVLPLLMLVHPRVRADRVLIYLATLATFYLALGVVILLVGDTVASAVSSLDGSRALDWAQVVVGLGLLVGSFWPDTPWAKAAARERAESGRPSRAQRWVDTIVTGDGRVATVAGVALVAGLIEAASMLPYLGALALIGASGVPLAAQIGILGAYNLTMIVPALALLAARLALRSRADALLERVAGWIGDRVGGAIWWVIGIAGFFLAADAVTRLGLLG
ncbi:GAP family protein [Aeromicrobium sp. CF3.5]|uniref:GAP family protein n=1 Tax=Aeromicrobium sp. CF3.5 TaxID=3373078 RepID=UPI003EE6574D